MAGHDHKAPEGALRHPECHDGGAVSGEEVFPARTEFPCLALQQLGVSGCQEPLFLPGNHVIHTGAVLDKVQKFLIVFSFHSPMLLCSGPTSLRRSIVWRGPPERRSDDLRQDPGRDGPG